MKVISLINPHSGCDYHRVKLPVTYLHKAGLIQGVVADSFEASLEQCEILLYNRLPFGRSLETILEARKRYGFKIVVDLDDYWQLYPGHYLERVWQAQQLEKHILRNLTIADAVICTSDRLKDKIEPYNTNVYVVPNGLPFGDLQFTPERAPGQRMRFMYCGGGSHFWDVRLLAGAMDKLARHNFAGEVILAGVADGVKIYRDMAGVMSAQGRLKHARTLKYQALDSYMDLYNDGDVALAPLVANSFNSHKSNLKVIEAGCKAMPIIVSNTGPYYDDECPYLMRVDSPGEWYKWIRFCHDNPSFVENNGGYLHEYVKQNYDIRILNFLRMEAFESVMKTVKYGKRADNQPVRE